jgi:hypothetical protein
MVTMFCRIVKWITEVAAQQERGSRKRAATDPPEDDTATLTGIKQPSPDAKRRRTSREIPI